MSQRGVPGPLAESRGLRLHLSIESRSRWGRSPEFDYRPHWGKYLPPSDQPIKSGKNDIWYGPDKLKTLYPKWDQWMQLRQKVDPDQIFLNDYWREHLGIKHSKKNV